jgi:hypothetical protein
MQRQPLAFGITILALAAGCGSGDEAGGSGGVTPGQGTTHVVLAWNDLGMHCLNPTYDQAVVLPPYNNIWAQVIERGNPPRIVTAGVTVEYAIVGNTYSYGKASFGQFWDNAQALFSAAPAHDYGLNLVDPSLSNGLSGTMVAAGGDHFEVDGVPLVPIDDSGQWNPYQVAEITVRSASGTVLGKVRATVPTSDELDCAKCHGPGPFADVLAKHDAAHGTALATQKPILCAKCHASPALGQLTRIGGVPFLSEAVHSFHAGVQSPPTCYDCHPGAKTQCSRSLAHTAADGNCTGCHGALAEVGGSIGNGARVPWVGEPACADCHAGVAEVATGGTLYRSARGHGGVRCAGCHGSPHAMVPTRVASDHAQSLQYQGAAKSLGSCGACHDSSRGRGSAEFGEEHGGAGETPSACNACHTAVSAATASWPHAFQWKAR